MCETELQITNLKGPVLVNFHAQSRAWECPLCCAGASQALSAHFATFLCQSVISPTSSVCSASHHNQQPSLPMASAFLSSVLPLGSSSPWMSARALRVVWIRRKGFNGSCTALLSSPYSASMLRHVLHKGSQPKTKVHSQSSTGGVGLVHLAAVWICCTYSGQVWIRRPFCG